MDSDNCDLEYRLPLLGDSLNLAGLEAITKQIKGGLISEGIFSLLSHLQKMFEILYRGSPDSTVFAPPGNRTIEKTVLFGD